jgi:formylglycine-generating enzyme required for sulfatase activity
MLRTPGTYTGALIVAIASGCSPKVKEVTSVGEVLVVVDTDMPVPKIVNRLRIDLYAEDGTWFESRDVGRERTTDWPTSFGVYLPDPNKETSVYVRLRAYLDGEVRDYRGERFLAPTATDPPFDIPTPTPVPKRLIRTDGTDATPTNEPEPATTIDRLVLVRVLPRARAAARVVLRGACVGMMADIAGKRSCTDTSGVLAAVTAEPTIADQTLPPSVAGTIATERCTAAVRADDGTHNDDVCVDGALFVYGSKDAFGYGPSDDVPRRVVLLPPFRIDRYEVTVARFRAGLNRGFVIPNGDSTRLQENDAALPTDGVDPNDPSLCTLTHLPSTRESFPLNCMTWDVAKAFCVFDGGDLPTEAQWEYVSSSSGRPLESRYSWGGDDNAVVKCEQAVFGRGPYPFDNECNLDGKTFGLLPVASRIGNGNDVTPGLGVVDLNGGLSEHMLDAFASLSSNCWVSQSLVAPACRADPADSHTARGANWSTSRQSLFLGFREGFPTIGASPGVGFRCVHPGK